MTQRQRRAHPSKSPGMLPSPERKLTHLNCGEPAPRLLTIWQTEVSATLSKSERWWRCSLIGFSQMVKSLSPPPGGGWALLGHQASGQQPLFPFGWMIARVDGVQCDISTHAQIRVTRISFFLSWLHVGSLQALVFYIVINYRTGYCELHTSFLWGTLWLIPSICVLVPVIQPSFSNPVFPTLLSLW